MAYTHYYPNSSIFHASILKYMGTQLDVILIGDDKEILNGVWLEIGLKISKLHYLLNKFDKNSEVYKLNSTAHISPFVVSSELFDIVQKCMKYNQLTNGYFDITLGNAEKIQLNEDDKSIFFTSEGFGIDLGGYGKGYALSQVKNILEKHKISNALINFGNSSILACGTHPYGDCWQISLNNPYTNEFIHTYNLYDTSLTISGNMPSHPQHIINPITKEYDQRKRISSVNCKDPDIGEVLTTASMLMDETEFNKLEISNLIIEKIIKTL